MLSWPKKVLMVRPNGYRVEYAINPYMRDASGALQKVDPLKAQAQWDALGAQFRALGLSVEILEGNPQYPDMVFCANQTLPYLSDRPSVLLSRMHSPQRQGEVQHFAQWAERSGLPITAVTDFEFEGAGDAIWNYPMGELYAGFGWRSDERAYAQVQKCTGAKIHLLKLVSEDFYHLDTCFAVLNATTAAYVPEAFDEAGRETLRHGFKTLIAIDFSEANRHFAGNCVSVDGLHVILQSGAEKFCRQLRSSGFTPVEVETGEFMKAGGSVFCMKQFLF